MARGDAARTMLIDAGWKSGRRVDITKDLAALSADGHETWPEVHAFLEEYSGLTLRFTDEDGDWGETWFDAARASGAVDPGWIEDYVPRAGTRLVPVGFGRRDHLLILLGEDGRWFGALDDLLGVLGDSPAEAIEALTHGHCLRERL